MQRFGKGGIKEGAPLRRGGASQKRGRLSEEATTESDPAVAVYQM